MNATSAQSIRYCDGLSRRAFFRIGAAGFGGLTLAGLLRAEEKASESGRKTNRAIINVHLGGGPPHLDMFDMKPDAPAEVRGEFKPIQTSVAGTQICELFPRLAKLAGRFSIVRSVVGSVGDHDMYQTASGWGVRDLQSAGGRPSVGAVAGKVLGPRAGTAPPFVDFSSRGMPGYLGPSHAAYSPNPYGAGYANLRLHRAITAERLGDRMELLRRFDHPAAQTEGMAAQDAFTRRAVDVLTSGRVFEALNLANEEPQVLERYRGNPGTNARAKLMSAHNERLLLARRLIEAGVRCVNLQWGGWDTHSDNFTTLRPQLPMMDAGFSALLEDLTDRGLIDDVLVVAWGEFGRTPRINKNNAGRDHWPEVGSALVFGGGLKGGRLVGATNRLGEHATERPVHFQELIATLYHQLGIDPEHTQLTDLSGRSQYLVDHREVVRELL
jgi:hypothetical protein